MTRRKAKKDVESDYEDSTPVDTKGKGKKRKVVGSDKDARAQQRKSGALLHLMVDTPVDVLLEIFKHLELIDLMHLSRTSKSLRSILMSRNSKFVWKQVVANEGLPSCPTGFNEPQLAELMFGKSCDWCRRNVSGQEIIWAARARACKRCIESTFESIDNFDRGYPDALVKHLPSVIIRNKKFIDRDLDREWHNEYRKRQQDEKAVWLTSELLNRRPITEHARDCQEWFMMRRQTHIRLRKAVIMDRLKERGWEEELNKLPRGSSPIEQLVEVHKACQSELTVSTLVSLDSVLDKHMEAAKAARLDRERKAFFKHMLERLREISREYSHTLPPNHILPNTADIYFHPTVKTALSVVETDEVLEDVLDTIQPLIPEIVDDCLKLSRQQLTDLVSEEYARSSKSFDPLVLTLASTIFQCKNCDDDLTLDQAMTHVCRAYYYNLPEDLKAVNSAINEVPTTHRVKNRISFMLKRLDRFISALHSCGIDVNMTTIKDMNEMDPIIECLGCSTLEGGRSTLTWISVAKHFQRFHNNTEVVLLDEREAEIARARMLEQYQIDTARTNDHICVHCRDSGGSMHLMRHVKQVHNIDSPVYGQDVVISCSASGIQKEFRLWPPRL